MKSIQFIENPEFIKARKELEDALKKYSATCDKIKSESGKLIGTDKNFGFKFHTNDGSQKEAQIVLTDC